MEQPKKKSPKPVKPLAPEYKNFPKEDVPSNEKSPFIIAYRKYQKDCMKYEKEIAVWEQTRLIEIIKKASTKRSLEKYHITKK